MQPLCFVLMPFGKKPLTTGALVDFDRVFSDLIAPAIKAAGMQVLRADQELVGGIIHKPMFERLMLCDFAVADLSGANANVFYELGLRHGIRPATTVPIFASTERLPFDVAMVRALPYGVESDGTLSDPTACKGLLTQALLAAKSARGEVATDSPVFQLVENFSPPDLARLKTDVFRDRAEYAADTREKLAQARREGKVAVIAFASSLGDIDQLEAGVVIDLLLSLRAVSAWQEMADLVGRMAAPLKRAVMVREQLGFALNRLEQRDHAEQVLVDLISEHGPNSETCGILGRVYKDRWTEAQKAGDVFAAAAWLDKSIATYVQGFEADWRDAYPGVNAVTLMEMKTPVDPRQKDLLPVVTYAVQRRIARGKPDYWDYATLLELEILNRREGAGMNAATAALAAVREDWEASSTANNLSLIRKVRLTRGESDAWADAIETRLLKRGQTGT
jgi:MAP3K TRAFs-binding domain